MDRGWHEIAPQRVHEHQRRETFGVAGVVGVVSGREGGTRLGLDRDHAKLASRCLVGKEGKCGAAEVRSPAATCDEHVRVVTNLLELLLSLEPDHGLMKKHVIENRSERIVGVGARRRLFDRLGDGDSKRARRIRLEVQYPSSRTGLTTRAGEHLSSPCFHHRTAKRLLLVTHADHVNPHLDTKHLTGHRERGTPLTRAGLSNESAYPGKLVVVGLRDGSVGLVRTGGTYALILVIDTRGSPERVFEANDAVGWRRTPVAIDFAN